MKKQNPNQPEHNETVVPVRSGIKENFIAPTPLDSEDRNYSFKLVVSALVVLASLAFGVIFLKHPLRMPTPRPKSANDWGRF